MSSSKSEQSTAVSKAEITLGVLNAVEQSSSVTQRTLANDLNIALGLANAYLKRCATKGFIKIKQVPRNRYAYYLTVQGFAEKSRLTGEYLFQSFNFFRAARKQCSELLNLCAERGWTKIALAGSGDLAEIVTLCALESKVEIVGIIDPGSTPDKDFAGLRVVQKKSDLDPVDAIIITDMNQQQKIFNDLLLENDSSRLMAPDFLHISRVMPTLMDEGD